MRMLLCAATALLIGAPAQSAVVWTFTETAEGVEGSFEGSLDFGSARSGGLSDSHATARIAPRFGTIDTGFAGKHFRFDEWTLPRFGDGESRMGGRRGDAFGLEAFDDVLGVVVPEDYVSGMALSGAISFVGATFEGLGIEPGTYFATLPDDTVTFVFGGGGSGSRDPLPSVTAVPLPATLPLMAAGLLALLRRRTPR